MEPNNRSSGVNLGHESEAGFFLAVSPARILRTAALIVRLAWIVTPVMWRSISIWRVQGEDFDSFDDWKSWLSGKYPLEIRRFDELIAKHRTRYPRSRDRKRAGVASE